MSVKKDESGRRSIQVEVEVPGTPEDVWEAIATGRGISSWFAEVEVEERVGGIVRCHMAPGMESQGVVTDWQPPHRMAAEGDTCGPNSPPMATEWTVEARSGGTCIVRVVHSLFASTDEWDDQLESIESGWPGFFRILQLYLRHYRGQTCSIVRAMAPVPGSEADGWDQVTAALGLADATAGQRCGTPSGVPALGGIVEEVGTDGHPSALLRLESPAPGIAVVHAFSMEGQAYVTLGLYLYGDTAADVAAGEAPLWDEWMTRRSGRPGTMPA